MEEYLITFSSTYRAMKAEKVLKRKGIGFRLVPVPTRLISGCGLGITFYRASKSLILSALKEKGVKISASFIKKGKNYIKVSIDGGNLKGA